MGNEPLPAGSGDRDEQPATQYFYYDIALGTVSQGPQRSWRHRMGPYATREEASRALEQARQRTQEWDEQDERDRFDD